MHSRTARHLDTGLIEHLARVVMTMGRTDQLQQSANLTIVP